MHLRASGFGRDFGLSLYMIDKTCEGHVPERLACIKSNLNTIQIRNEYEREYKRKYERQSSSSGQYNKNTSGLQEKCKQQYKTTMPLQNEYKTNTRFSRIFSSRISPRISPRIIVLLFACIFVVLSLVFSLVLCFVYFSLVFPCIFSRILGVLFSYFCLSYFSCTLF